jgi:transglutaminase-like putative cysteine protease
MSMAAKPRQLNLDELRRLKWLLGGAMSLVALWTVFFLDIEALGLVAVTGSVILAVLVWPQLPGRVPPLVWKLAVPAIIVAMAADFYFSPDTLPVLIRLAILLVFYRTVSYRRKREDLQLIVLSLFLVVVAGVLTSALGFAFLLLLFTACGLGFLFVITLIDASETGGSRTPEAETAWTRLDWRRFFSRLRGVADWRLLAFAAALFTAVVAMSGLLFLIIPRFELASGFFLDRYITRKSRTGFTDTVKFGDVTELIRDESVAMRVDLTDTTGLRESPYWRLVVLDEYTPEGFKVSAGLKGELIRGQRVTQQLRGRQLGREINPVGGSWTFYIEPGVSRFLPLPGSYSTLRMREVSPLQFSAGHRVVALRTEPMTMTAFQLDEVELTPVLIDARFPQLLKAARETPPAGTGQYRYDPLVNLRGPVGEANEAVLNRVVAEITGGAELSAEEFTRRAILWLQARHAYALSARLPAGPGKDDIVRWLDSNEPGFCEYFAASLTVLARAAGHPARVVAGFHGGVLNGFENYYMVRNSDAHAWAEVYDGKTAWVRADPTPGAVNTPAEIAAQAAQREQDSSWSARVDSLRVLWYRRIVNFDSRAQVQMLDSVKTFTTDSGVALRARFDEFSKRLKAWLQQPWDAARAGRLAGLIAGVGALGWLLWSLGQWAWSRWRQWHRPQTFDPVRQKAGRWLARMREQTRGQTTDDGEQIITAVREDLRRLRYGRRETWPEPRGVFRRAKQARRAAKR